MDSEFHDTSTGFIAGGLAFNVVLFQMLVKKGIIDADEFEARVMKVLEDTKSHSDDDRIDEFAEKYVQLLLDVSKHG